MSKQQNRKYSSSEKNLNFRSKSPLSQKIQSQNQQNNNKKNFKYKIIEEDKLQLFQYPEKRYTLQRKFPLTTKDLIKKYQNDNESKKQVRIPMFVKKAIQNNKKLKNSLQKTMNDGYKNKIDNQVASQNQTIQFIDTIFLKQKQDEYKKINMKLDFLRKKISQMKVTLDKNRNQKIEFIQSQRNQRIKLNLQLNDQKINPEQSLKKFITKVPQHRDLHPLNQNPYSPKHSIYYVSQVLRGYKQQKSLVRQHIHTSLQYLHLLSYRQIPNQRVSKTFLPKLKGYEDKKTVIFDLDQTLIHCAQNIQMPSDLKINVKFPTGEMIQVGINIRPYVKQMLASLSTNFQIIVFTASHSCYANVVLDYLDPQKKYIHHRLYRQHCYCTAEGIYVKDLRIINRPLSKTILVDNAAYSYAYQLLNGVPIIPYYEGKNDYQLPALQKYIQSLIFVADVREKNKSTFKLERYLEFNDLNRLVETLYSSNGNNS